MDQKKIAKQMIDFNKTAFDNIFSSMIMLQEQAEKMTSTLLNQATGLPDEGKKVINEWIKAYKKGREDYKKAVDESFEKVEDFFADTEKATKTKPEKASKE